VAAEEFRRSASRVRDTVAQMEQRRVMSKLVLGLATLGIAASAVTAHASPTSEPEPDALVRAQAIRAQIDARYRRKAGPALAVTEASTTGVVESFTFLTSDLLGVRIVPAEDGIYFAICPVRATCPYPARRHARRAADLLLRRMALELALRTFLETSANVVAVSLPTPRFILFIVEREELARDVDMLALASELSDDPARADADWPREVVREVTRPRVFVALGLEATHNGRDTFIAMPLWPTANASLSQSRRILLPPVTACRCGASAFADAGAFE